MSRCNSILIITVLLISQFVFSQNKKDDAILKALDSVKPVRINPLAPSKAAFYSAVVPGLGQIYNKKYWKVPLVYIGLGTGLYFYTTNNNKYHDFRSEYKKRLNGTSDPNDPYFGGLDNNRLVEAQKFYQRNRDLSMLITVGIYILNIVDANVDAHLMQFNVNDNLSVRPDIYQNDMNYKHSLGLTLNYNF